MVRNRVLSFMSQLSGQGGRESIGPTPNSSPPRHAADSPLHGNHLHKRNSSTFPLLTGGSHNHNIQNGDTPTPPPPVTPPQPSSPVHRGLDDSPPPESPVGRGRSNSRPLSMIQTFNPPLMDVNDETIPELQPIFTFLNSHANKLYQEGYFLKLDDQNTQGRPNPDRTWTECFAQLVGTVLSLWDAAELDAAGENGEVLPKFINLTDASIKMIESLPTRSNDEQPLQNILSISTAGRNRYLLHFNSHHSLLQWTAGIRLAMFEHSTLQEAYTGALIAGKGKTLNNINLIMERARFKTEEWVRVRFGAGVPWRRCWCVISPPDEKEFLRVQKELKKKSPYDHKMPMLKGDIKFYDTKKDGKKQKKAKPIASITDAYSCYSIYPQAKSLIDASTLIKVEGNITIHSDPPSSTEGFVFIMPEVHPAVSGFEMLLRFLFPTWDTFCLYGRPGRLVASVLDSRSLMFAMPKHKRYGYLEIMDVIGLIDDAGSGSFSEREWRKRLKELTGQRMNAIDDASTAERNGSRRSKRLSVGPGSAKPRVGFADENNTPGVRTSRSFSLNGANRTRDNSAPPADRMQAPPSLAGLASHQRNSSDSQLGGPGAPHISFSSPNSPARGGTPVRFAQDLAPTPERVSSEDERPGVRDLESLRKMQTPEPVQAPPAFSHGQQSGPAKRPYHSPELRRAHSRLSTATLAQLAGANAAQNVEAAAGRQSSEDSRPSPGVNDPRGPPAMSMNASREALTSPSNPTPPRSPAFPPAGQQQRGPVPNLAPGAPGQRGPSPGPRQGPPGGPAGRGAPPPNGAMGPPSPGFGAGRGLPPVPAKIADGRQPSPGPGARGDGYQPFQPRGPPPPPHSSQGNGPPTPQGRQPPPLASGGAAADFHRKPIPSRADSLQRRGEPGPPQRNASLQSQTRGNHAANDSIIQNHGIDESVLQMIDAHQFSPQQQQQQQPEYGGRSQTMRSNASSNYEDASSTTSPSYASSPRPSMDTQGSVDRPRAGVMRTVGDVNHGQPRPGQASDLGIPDVNFGPTVNYAPRNKAAPPPLGAPGQPYRGPPADMRSPRGPPPGGPSHGRNDSEDTLKAGQGRSMPWSPPGMGPGPNQGRQGALSPEQFVQQRAVAAATPLYSHQRTPSGRMMSPELRSPRSDSFLGAGQGRPQQPQSAPYDRQQFAQQHRDYRAPGPGSAGPYMGGRGGPGPGPGPGARSPMGPPPNKNPMNSPPLQQAPYDGRGQPFGGAPQQRSMSPGPGYGGNQLRPPMQRGPGSYEQRPHTAGSMRGGQGPGLGPGQGFGGPQGQPGPGQGRGGPAGGPGGGGGGGGGGGMPPYRQGY